MDVRSALGTLQLPVATLGLALLLVALVGIATMDPPPAGSDGFVGGLAVFFLYIVAWVGFLVLSLGLAIPPLGGYGLRFTRPQRGLFLLAGLAAFLSAVGPLVAFGLVFSNPGAMVLTWLAITAVGILSLVGGVVWRGVQVWRDDAALVVAGGS
ncbi:hypothetical protein ACFQJ5_15540 [Halomicroarcula sp. GCM10025324]|uniref:hypothetical protein n=1 Tax=Haloarcula TaxID=2237 RepID=UPI0023E88DC9|nr:hypothetical protein [Halomicroarcula sp. ZS-22-S1]